MTLEELRKLLEAEAITQQQFDDMVKAMGLVEEPAPEPEPTPEPESTIDDKFNKLFQSKFDRAMANERKEKAELKKQLEKLQKKMLTEEEAKELEFAEQRKELEEQRRELALEKNKMYAVKAMKKANIHDTEDTMSIIERVVLSCEDETDIDETIALLKSWHDAAVKAEVDKRFREGGYTPKSSGSLNGGVNPYAKEQFNLTKQMEIELNNPDLAKQLQAAAGIKK